jgi:hypothetical protein
MTSARSTSPGSEVPLVRAKQSGDRLMEVSLLSAPCFVPGVADSGYSADGSEVAALLKDAGRVGVVVPLKLFP